MRNVLMFILTLFAVSLCLGADYPSKPVRLVVPFGAGGTVDTTARMISQHLSVQLGERFIVDNKLGAGGTIGNALVAKANPDGYTLMLMDTSTAMAPGLYKSITFDVARDFAPITQIMGAPQVLVVRPSLKANTLKEFLALAQANPGKLNYGSAGVGGAIHLLSELFKSTAKVNIVHVPYSGGSAARVALLGGESDMQISTISTVLGDVKSGKMRALAVTTDGKRSPALPDVPSMSEAGLPGMRSIYSWYGLAGPAGMPKEIVNKLYQEVVRALAIPSVKESYIPQGAELPGSSPEEFSNLIRVELRRWDEVIKSIGITPE